MENFTSKWKTKRTWKGVCNNGRSHADFSWVCSLLWGYWPPLHGTPLSPGHRCRHALPTCHGVGGKVGFGSRRESGIQIPSLPLTNLDKHLTFSFSKRSYTYTLERLWIFSQSDWHKSTWQSHEVWSDHSHEDDHTQGASPWGMRISLCLAFPHDGHLCKFLLGDTLFLTRPWRKYSLSREMETLNPHCFTHDPQKMVASERTTPPMTTRVLTMVTQTMFTMQLSIFRVMSSWQHLMLHCPTIILATSSQTLTAL